MKRFHIVSKTTTQLNESFPHLAGDYDASCSEFADQCVQDGWNIVSLSLEGGVFLFVFEGGDAKAVKDKE